MNSESARGVIVALVEHGFDRRDLMAMGHAELQWWFKGHKQHQHEKAEAQRRANEEVKKKRKR